jgi:hypothetical protein
MTIKANAQRPLKTLESADKALHHRRYESSATPL